MVVELLARYLRFAIEYYRKPDEKQNHEIADLRTVSDRVRALYGCEPADEFGPKSLKAVRAGMIQAGWSRKSITKQVGRIRRTFKWCTEEELIPATS